MNENGTGEKAFLQFWVCSFYVEYIYVYLNVKLKLIFFNPKTLFECIITFNLGKNLCWK